MANRPTPMYKLRRLITLRIEGKSKRELSRLLSLSRPTIDHYLTCLEGHFDDLRVLSEWTDEQLARFLGTSLSKDTELHSELYALFPGYEKELSKVGVTRMSLWMDYKQKYPSGLKYSHFCEHFRRWQKRQHVVMHLEHKAGDKLFVDFAGSKLYLTDIQTGELRPVECFVAILPCSQLTYAEACLSQKKADFLSCLENAMIYAGGVPQAIVPDNLKAAVTKADRYEPTLNEAMEDFGAHYNTCIYPARSRRPRDKALVESAVNIIYNRVYAPLRNRTFHTLSALNEAIKELVESHNLAKMQGKDYCRRERFEQLERSCLQALPTQKYQLKSFSYSKVQPNCHVLLKEDKHYYSVPYELIGREVKLIYTTAEVEIYYQYQRVALHERMDSKHHYTTTAAHLPPQHQWLTQWSPTYFENWASKIGPNTRLAIVDILRHRTYPEQAYKSCAGVLSLEKKVGKDRLEAACRRAIAYKATSLRLIKSILERELDKVPVEDEKLTDTSFIIHENIRGAHQYQ